MPANHIELVAACLAMVLLVAVVGAALFVTRVRELRRKRIHPQRAAANSLAMASHFEDVQVADNFRNLFEVPVLFYALAAIALGIGHVPEWLVVCAWIYVALRVLHSFVHCTYNKVYHRLAVFAASFVLLVGMWVAYFASLASRSGM